MTLDGSPIVKQLDLDSASGTSNSSSSTRYSPLLHETASPGWTPDTLPDVCGLEISPPPSQQAPAEQVAGAQSTYRGVPPEYRAGRYQDSPTADTLDPSLSLDPSQLALNPVGDSCGPLVDDLSEPSCLNAAPATVSQPGQPQQRPDESAWRIGQQFATPTTVSCLQATGGEEPKPKRGRGRPRKFPLQEKPVKPKGVKNARSKTGCLTCRRRKKKCDETKPTCINCRKNGKPCEGYPEPATPKKPRLTKKAKANAEEEDAENFRGARNAIAANFGDAIKVDKAEGEEEGEEEEDEEGEDDNYNDDDASGGDDDDDDDDEDECEDDMVAASEPAIPSDWAQLDSRLEEHFNRNSDQFFPPWTGGSSGHFHNVMTWLAQQHQGVRHGLLCLSAQQLMKQHPDSLALQQRYMHHLGKGVEYQLELGRLSPHSCGSPNPPANDAYTALALIFCLANEMSGAEQLEGFMLPHYRTVVHMAHHCPLKSRDAAFQKLVEDFFYHHNLLALVTSMDQGIRQDDAEDFKLPEFVDMAGVTLFGGANGLWVDLSHIHAMRERMRRQRQQNPDAEWPCDMGMHLQAHTLEDSLIHEPIAFTPGTWQHAAASLYRLSTLIYLYRTVMPSHANGKLAQVVDRGIQFLQQLVQNHAAQGVLLMPLFLLGCASFEPAQRQQVELAFEQLVEQRGDGNVQRALKIVRAVWDCMDAHDDASWDWEALGQRMGCTLIVP